MTTKVYKFLGIDTAMHLLRPGAKWEISNNVFTRWDDYKSCHINIKNDTINNSLFYNME